MSILIDGALQTIFTPTYLKDEAGKKILSSNAWKSGAIFGKTELAMQHAWHNNLKGQLPIAILSLGLAAGTARKGHALSAMSRSLVSVAGGIIGGVLAGKAGQIAGSIAGDKVLGGGVEKAVQFLADIGGPRGKINMGGNFEDSQQAWTMRQQAVQSMATSNLNARRYLGSEAAMLHT